MYYKIKFNYFCLPCLSFTDAARLEIAVLFLWSLNQRRPTVFSIGWSFVIKYVSNVSCVMCFFSFFLGPSHVSERREDGHNQI